MPEAFDAIVIGTRAGGGMAIRTLTEAGLRVCALDAGRRLDPARDFRRHRMPYDLPYRRFGNPRTRDRSSGYMDNEYVEGVWEHEIAFTTAPGTEWVWPRCFAVGGKTNFWGRSSAGFGDIDFKAATLDGAGVDFPVTYAEIAPYYARVERAIGVASTVQGRPSNPDGEYLPPIGLRCLDRILQAGASKAGVPYLPDRIAQLTRAHASRPACQYCGCTEGCDTGSFFSTPYFLLPAAERTGRLELRTNALAREILTDERGHARGVAYVDRLTRQEVEVTAKAVVVAASCLESTKILLNSRSRHWPSGIANASGQLGRNLCDHLYGTAPRGWLPQLAGQAPFPDNVSGSTVAWMPRWQNLANPREEKFVRGYSVYPGGGCSEFPGYERDVEGFGSSCLRVHFEWDSNTLQMWEHAKHACADVLRASGGEYTGAASAPEPPGFSLHETGTCRMGDDPQRFVTDRWGRAHHVPNLYGCDASVFPWCTDKTTTLSILAFTLRTCERLVEGMRSA